MASVQLGFDHVACTKTSSDPSDGQKEDKVQRIILGETPYTVKIPLIQTLRGQRQAERYTADLDSDPQKVIEHLRNFAVKQRLPWTFRFCQPTPPTPRKTRDVPPAHQASRAGSNSD